MACCDGCAKSGGSCGDKVSAVALAPGWSLGGVGGYGGARVGALVYDETLSAEANWKNGITVGFIGGAATVAGVLGALWLMRGR